MVPFFLALLLFCSCHKKEPNPPAPHLTDFESLMGKNLPAWQYVRTEEDLSNLSFFKTVYEKNIPLSKIPPATLKIPHVIHFIWIGPKSFPIDSVDNVRSWIGNHPGWTVKFWTDRVRPLPHPEMQLCLITPKLFSKVGECYARSDNYGEQSDLLRYEILFQEGGIYVDHDVKCFKSFEPFHHAYDFFCGLELPFKTTLSSSLLPTNNIVASAPGHPILRRSLNWLKDNWERIEKEYPGKDRESTINRVSHRTFLVLGESFKAVGNQGSYQDIAFPAFYFNAPKDEWALWARHLYAGSWFENESAFEKMTRERLMMLSKKTNKLLLFLGVSSVLNLLGFAVLGIFLYKNYHFRHRGVATR